MPASCRWRPGEVKPEGIALTLVLGSRGSWPARAEMLSRAVQDPKVQGGEWSMAQYLYRSTRATAAMSACRSSRCETSRRATSTSAGAVRSGGPRISPASASACTAGAPAAPSGIATSCAMWGWTRPPSSGGSATSTRRGPRSRWTLPLPPGVSSPPPGRSLSDMLIAGELEAIYSPPRPQAYHPETGADRAPVPGLPPGRAGVLPQDRRLSSPASDRPPAGGLGGESLDRQEPHRGVQRGQRMLHRGPEGLPLRHAVAGGRAGGDGGRDGRGLPPLRLRA